MSDLSMRQGAERMREAIHEQEIADWKSDYDKLLQKLYEKDEKITELERHNELLRAVGDKAHFMAWCYVEEPEKAEQRELRQAVSAAIDGGALDGEK